MSTHEFRHGGEDIDFRSWESELPARLVEDIEEDTAWQLSEHLLELFERLSIEQDSYVFHSLPTAEGSVRFAATPAPDFESDDVPTDIYRLTLNRINNNYDGQRGVRIEIVDTLISPLNMSTTVEIATHVHPFQTQWKLTNGSPPLIKYNEKGYFLSEARQYLMTAPKLHSAERPFSELQEFRRVTGAFLEFLSKLSEATGEPAWDPETDSSE